MIKNANGRDVFCGDSVKIRPHRGASKNNLIDLIVVIHTGTNYLQNNGNIVKMAKKSLIAVKDVDNDHSLKIAFSSKINREDEHFRDKTNDVNNKLKNYCSSASMNFIDNSDIAGRKGAFMRDEVNSLDNHSDISEMKNLRVKNP